MSIFNKFSEFQELSFFFFFFPESLDLLPLDPLLQKQQIMHPMIPQQHTTGKQM